MDRYLSGEEIDAKVLIEDLEKAVARGSFYPVLAASAPQRHRHGRAARGDDRRRSRRPPSTRCRRSPRWTASPSPASASDPDGPLLAEVVKTTVRPLRGPDQPGPGVLRHAAPGRLGARVRARPGRPRARGPRRRRAGRRADLAAGQAAAARSPQCAAGDICAVAKLTSAETGDTLSEQGAARC